MQFIERAFIHGSDDLESKFTGDPAPRYARAKSPYATDQLLAEEFVAGARKLGELSRSFKGVGVGLVVDALEEDVGVVRGCKVGCVEQNPSELAQLAER
ncbi:hypothetical protein D3C71_1878230 [compost metagenome]